MQGYLKCNIDFATFADQHVGFGSCFRNDQGHFVMARTQSSVACVTTAEGELEKAILMCNLRLCQIIVKAIYQQKQLMSLKWVLLFVRLGP